MGGWGARVGNFTLLRIQIKKNKLFCCLFVREGEEGARVSDFFTMNPNLKKKQKLFFFLGGGGGGGGGGVRGLE